MALAYFFNAIQNPPSAFKGIIVDVRNNAGGNIADLNFFLGHLIDKPLLWGYTHYKSGNGRLAFTPWISSYISPQIDGVSIDRPIIVLADNYSVSLAEAVVMAIHTMPGGIFIGETTWGATGPIVENAIYNDGRFIVPSFLSVYTSSAAFKYIDGKTYENKGFPPDRPVRFNLPALLGGDDPILDTALSLLR